MPRLIPRPLSQAVVSTCLSQIANEEYPPGTNLPPEGKLAQEFGVSRIVIREAIRTLSAKGVVAVRQGRNTVVNPVDHWNQLDPQVLLFRIKAGKGRALAQDLVEIRRMLEVEAAGLAAVRATEEDIVTLRELLASMVAAVPDATMHSPLENQFHARIWHAASNALLLHLLKTLGEVFGAAKEFVYGSNLPDWDMYHITLLEAIERHDVDGARQAMNCDIARFEEELRIEIEKGPKLATAVGPPSGFGKWVGIDIPWNESNVNQT